MEKKKLLRNPDQWYYVFREISLADLMKPAGEITLYPVDYASDLSYFPLSIKLKRAIQFGSYEEALEHGVHVNKHTKYVYLPGNGFMGSDLSELPHEGTDELLLRLSLCWRVREDETLTEQQIQSIYHDFARRLLGPWYLI